MITSVMDIILDVVLAFRDDYESYIKVGHPFKTIYTQEKVQNINGSTTP